MIILIIMTFIAVSCSYTLATWYFTLMLFILFVIQTREVVGPGGILHFSEFLVILNRFDRNLNFQLVVLYFLSNELKRHVGIE